MCSFNTRRAWKSTDVRLETWIIYISIYFLKVSLQWHFSGVLSHSSRSDPHAFSPTGGFVCSPPGSARQRRMWEDSSVSWMTALVLSSVPKNIRMHRFNGWNVQNNVRMWPLHRDFSTPVVVVGSVEQMGYVRCWIESRECCRCNLEEKLAAANVQGWYCCTYSKEAAGFILFTGSSWDLLLWSSWLFLVFGWLNGYFYVSTRWLSPRCLQISAVC